MNRQLAATIGLIGLIGFAAVVYRPLAARIQARQSVADGSEFRVLSPADSGPGTLRAAIFAALRSQQPSEIVLLVSRIRLNTPLPPLVASHRLLISGEGSNPIIDAENVSSGPVLEVLGPDTTLRGFQIVNARDRAIAVRARSLSLERVTVSGSDVAVHLSAAADLRLVDSSFHDNRIGLRIDNRRVSGVISGNRFEDHRDAAIWAVGEDSGGPDQISLVVTRNHFAGDRHGVVAANLPLRISDNEFASALAAGVLLLGRHAEVVNNRIRNGAAMGVAALGAGQSKILDNEIDHNGAVAILVRASTDLNVSGNNIYNNAYGIAAIGGAPGAGTALSANMVLSNRFDGIVVIGDSSIVTHNRFLGNSGAGMRILDLLNLDQTLVVSNPLVQDNVIENNGTDTPVRGQYVVRPDEL